MRVIYTPKQHTHTNNTHTHACAHTHPLHAHLWYTKSTIQTNTHTVKSKKYQMPLQRRSVTHHNHPYDCTQFTRTTDSVGLISLWKMLGELYVVTNLVNLLPYEKYLWDHGTTSDKLEVISGSIIGNKGGKYHACLYAWPQSQDWSLFLGFNITSTLGPYMYVSACHQSSHSYWFATIG